jgi:hypothetical protein
MPHDDPVTSQDVQPTGRPNARMRQTVGDMGRSMAVVLAVVAVLVLANWRPQPEAVKVVDVTPVVALAGNQAHFPLRQPAGLPDSWRPTSARWQPTAKSAPDPVLHIGYVTPNDEYAQVAQSANSSARYLDEQTDGGVLQGQSTIGADTWSRLEVADRRSLVLTRDGVVTVISGTASWAELERLAASLVPVVQSAG